MQEVQEWMGQEKTPLALGRELLIFFPSLQTTAPTEVPWLAQSAPLCTAALSRSSLASLAASPVLPAGSRRSSTARCGLVPTRLDAPINCAAWGGLSSSCLCRSV